MRLSTWLWLGLVALVGYVMFQVKYQVMGLEDQLARVDRSIVADRDGLRVLNAEWSYLNEPTRLDRLRQHYLTLTPIGRAQLTSLDQVPFRTANPAQMPGAAPAQESSNPVVPAPRQADFAASVQRVSAKTGTMP